MTASQPARHDRIEAALSAGPQETHRLVFRGQTELLPVIRLALSDTVLNHRSHRIRAQLEGVPNADQIRQDPENDQSQATIQELLRTTPRFNALKDNLQAEGQREPGVVTRTGLLVNGNTRAVALVDLEQQYIDVAVLPGDATIPELYAVEADLQVAADFRQDYSFTNELLFVHDLISEQQRSEEQVALQMRWATPGRPTTITKGIEQVRRYTRHLAFIREIQALSGRKVPLVDFDSTAQTLQEFDARYESLRIKNAAGAREMKMAVILAILADLGYQASREIKPGWADEHLAEALTDNPVLNGVVQAINDDADADDDDDLEGLDVLAGVTSSGQDETSVQQVVVTLVERLGKSAQDDEVSLPTPEGEQRFTRQVVIDAVQDAMKAAAESAKEAAALGDALKAATVHCAEAAKRLTRAADAWTTHHTDHDFDQAAFDRALEKAERALTALKQRTSS